MFVPYSNNEEDDDYEPNLPSIKYLNFKFLQDKINSIDSIDDQLIKIH
jgi:hypothetical protein